MYRRRIPRSILHQILPEHRVPRHRAKRHPIIPRLITIQKLAPPLIMRLIQYREIRAPAGQVARSYINEEGSQTVAADIGRPAVGGREPVGVQVVSLVVSVLHELEGLEVGTRRVEALEEESSRLDAPDDGVAGYGGGL
jgi:hypothetical protein